MNSGLALLSMTAAQPAAAICSKENWWAQADLCSAAENYSCSADVGERMEIYNVDSIKRWGVPFSPFKN